MSGHGLRRALARVTAGKTMDRTEAVALLAARDQELEQLCRAASLEPDAGLAAAGREGLITYSRKVFVPLTRLCRDRCHCRGSSVRGHSRGARQSADATEVADLDVIPFHPGVSGLNASLSAAEEAVRTGSCRLRHGGLDLLRQDVNDMADLAVVNRRFEDIR
jgi:hypothetical protein